MKLPPQASLLAPVEGGGDRHPVGENDASNWRKPQRAGERLVLP
jgi:hypothetical protein